MQGSVLHLYGGIVRSHHAIAYITTDKTVVEGELGIAARSLNYGSLLTGHGIVVEDAVLHFHIHSCSGSVAQEEGGALRGSAVGYHAIAYLDVFHRLITIAIDNGNARTSLKGKLGQHTARNGIGKV